jgi:hypothetical protein
MSKNRIVTFVAALLMGGLAAGSSRADSLFHPNPWNTPGDPPGPNARGCYHFPWCGIRSYIYTYRDGGYYTYAPDRHPEVPTTFKYFRSPCAAVEPSALYPPSQPRPAESSR